MANKKILIVVIVVIALVTASFLLWKYKFANTTSTSAIPTISPVDVGKDISNKIVNPSLPQTNPFSAQTNPFKNVYQNPF